MLKDVVGAKVEFARSVLEKVALQPFGDGAYDLAHHGVNHLVCARPQPDRHVYQWVVPTQFVLAREDAFVGAMDCHLKL